MSHPLIWFESGRKLITMCPGKNVLLYLITTNNLPKPFFSGALIFQQEFHLESFTQNTVKGEGQKLFSDFTHMSKNIDIHDTFLQLFLYGQPSVLVSTEKSIQLSIFTVFGFPTLKNHITKMPSCLSFLYDSEAAVRIYLAVVKL